MHEKVQVAIIDALTAGGRALLLQTNAKRGQFWQNVTGSVEKIDHQNSPQDAFGAGARRELMEETGIREAKFFPLSLQFEFLDRKGRQVLEKCFAVILKKPSSLLIKLDPKEHQTYRWVALKDFQDSDMHYPGNAQVMREAIKLAQKFLGVLLILVSTFSAPSWGVDNLEEMDKLDALSDIIIREDSPGDEVKEGQALDLPKGLQKYDFHQARRPSPPADPIVQETPKIDITMTAGIRKGATLFNLKTQQKMIVPVTIFVYADASDLGKSAVGIFTKSGELKYEARAEDVTFIQNDLDLSPDPKYYQAIREPDKSSIYDKELRLQHQFAFGFESTSDPYNAQIFSAADPQVDRDAVLSASGTRLDYRLYFISPFPLNAGLAFSYESGSWSESAEGFSWSSMHLGPTLQYYGYLSREWGLRGRATVQQDINYQVKSKTGRVPAEYSVTSLELAFEGLHRTPIGTFSLGLQYHSTRMALQQTDLVVRTDSERKNLVSLGFSLGYTFDQLF